MSIKQQLVETVKELPESVTIEEAIERIYLAFKLKQVAFAPTGQDEIRRKVQVGLAQVQRGEARVLEGDEAIEHFFDELEAEVDAEIASKPSAR